MSMDAMEVDHISPPASERKRKNKEKDRHSSKKRKHHEDSAAEVDASPAKDKKKEKKSKHKHRKSPEIEQHAKVQDDEAHLSKKKKKHHKHGHEEQQQDDDASTLQALSPLSTRKPLSKASASQLVSTSSESHDSPFHLVTSTLYVPLSPISISPTHALSSLLAEHVSPLLLTYYPPFRGLVLAYSNPSISSTPPSSGKTTSDTQDNPQPLTLAVTANEYGVLYVYLTATFLIFRPERGQTLEGWVNVQSDGFLGAVVHNLFSVGIERRRLPQDWEWVAPGQENNSNNNTRAGTSNNSPTTPGTNADEETDFDSDKENFRPLPASTSAALGLGLDLNDPTQQQENQALEDEESAATGYFRTRSGRRVRGTIQFRVRDIDVIPGADRDKGFLSIEGTMLSPDEEAKLVAEERSKAMGFTGRGRAANADIRMSGAVGGVVSVDGGEGSGDPEVAEILPEPTTTMKKKREKKSRKSTS